MTISRPFFASAVAVAVLAFAGSAIAETPAQLAANKKLVLSFWHDVFDAQDVSKAKLYLAPGDGYVQHNPMVPTGLSGFEMVFGKMFPKPKAPADVVPTKFVAVLADGDLVQLMSKRPRPDPTAPGKTYDSFWFDLFRVKDGKIVEHWDGALKTPPSAAPNGP